MSQYNLQSDEGIILKQNRIVHGGVMAAPTNELILTNKNIILISKGLFGNTKKTTSFPIDQIKVFNNRAQAFLGKRSNGTPQLEVYFTTGQEYFGFDKKRLVRDWVTAINQLVLGEEITIDGLDNRAIPGTEHIANTIKDTFHTIQDILGSKKPKKVTDNCKSCGASLVGFEGQIVCCQYCSTDQQL